MMDECIFKSIDRCKNPRDQKLKVAGSDRITSIIKASRIYEDNLHNLLEPQVQNKDLTIKYHNSCVATYVSNYHIQKFLDKTGTKHHDAPPAKRMRRSMSETVFDFEKHCLFCGEECVMDVDSRHPDRWRRVVLCRTVDRTGQNTFKKSIIETCDERADSKAEEVKARVLSALSDLHAADARYHKDCRDSFMVHRSVNYAKNTTVNQETDSAFLSTTSEIEADMTRIWNSVELHSLYISKGGERLSRRTLVVELCDHFGSDLLLLSGKGVANILVFKSKASQSLRLVSREEGDEIDIALETISKSIIHESKDIDMVKRHYRSSVDIQVALNDVSPTLLSLLSKLSGKLAYTMPAAMIGNIITSVIRNGVTNLQVAMGNVLNKRHLIERFYDLGVSCSYDEILRFKASAAAAAVKDSRMTGLKAPKDGLIQVVADNFDANISTQNGLLSTHSLAMLITVPDSHDGTEKEDEMFPRLTLQDARGLVIEDTRIERYKGPKKPEMPANEARRTILPLRVLAHQVVAVSRAQSTDFDFFREVTSDTNTPEFNGFNTKLAREQGHSLRPKTRAIYRPLIDMTPSDPDTILTAMADAQELTNGCGQTVTIFTNDQQLYKVAVGITWVYQDRFLNFLPRLGGMHLLMSFIGCVGNLMANTGLEDILKAGFGSVAHMLSGKKFPQNFRALRIVAEAVLSSTVKEAPGPGEMLVSLETVAEQSKTTKLWVDCLIKPVFLMMFYVRAEREADWPLHLYAVKEMLPYFFAAGHHNYARYGIYYLRSMERLPKDVLDHFMCGHHVMRHNAGIWNAVWSDMFIESTFMRYGHGANGIIGITLKPSALKKWAFSMHISSQLEKDVTEMTRGHHVTEVTTHKEEKPSRVMSDNEDRQKIQEKLLLFVDPLDPTEHPEGIVNIVTGLIAPATVNVERAVAIGETLMTSFENSLPTGFHGTISKQVVTMNASKKSIKVGGKDVYDINLIYSRVLGLQQSREIDFKDVLKHELSPIPMSMFKETGEMRIATGKSSLKNKLKVTVSSRIAQDSDVVIMDGCAILWCVHWPCKGIVQDYIENFCSYVIRGTNDAHVYLVFDRYLEYSIKGSTRSTRSEQHVSRRHRLNLSSPLPPQKVVLTVAENKRQLIDMICAELVRLGLSGYHFLHSLVVTGKDPKPVELRCGIKIDRADLSTTHEEADVIMVQQAVELAESGAACITVVSDDTDVFILLIHFYAERNLSCKLFMEATGSDRAVIDIAATAHAHSNIVPHLLTMHCLTGCDTVAQLFGVGKATALKAVEAGYHVDKLGDLETPLLEVVNEATEFIAHCYGSTCKSEHKPDMSEIRVQVWSRKMSRKRVTSAPELKALPPTTQAFKENVCRAHVQAAIWKSTLLEAPPSVDETKFGWSRDETSKTLMPVTLPSDVALAPLYVLEMIKCGCASDQPCQNAHCGCEAAHLPCTFFCACNGENNCQNPYNKETETDESPNDDEISVDELLEC